MPASRLRWVLVRAAAVLFAAATALYSLTWMYAVRRQPTAFLGIDPQVSRGPCLAIAVRSVIGGSAAERAGLRPGDRLVRMNGRPIETYAAFADAVSAGQPGDRITFAVERPGAVNLREIATVLGAPPPPEAPPPLARRLATRATELYPLLFLVATIAVLALRPADPHAWLLALLFGGLLAAAPLHELETPRALRPFQAAYCLLLSSTQGAVFLFFFSVFPARSPLDRRTPWLKWLCIGVSGAIAVVLAGSALTLGGAEPAGVWIATRTPWVFPTLVTVAYGSTALGFVSLVANGLSGPPLVRRKIRVIVWGAFLCLLPALVVFGGSQYFDVLPFALPLWIWAPSVILASLFPLPFVYAVARYRVLEIPALLRSSARYLLVQRGSLGLLLMLGVAAAVWFSASLGSLGGPRAQPLAAGLGVAFGTLLIWAGANLQRRVREHVDRAFFRSAYDARKILEDLAEKTRATASRADLVSLIEGQVVSALYPASLSVYVEYPDGSLRREGSTDGAAPATLPPTSLLLAELARKGEPRELAPVGSPPDEAWLAPLGAECLVPLLGRLGRLNGLLALGPRLSEAPYSRDDKRLLASVASQAGIALDSLRLAEAMAERLEAERLSAHERELAQRVQNRLLPQEVPILASLELAGRCVQARAVGGDYYDFLEPGDGRVGLVLADISGKGFPAALLMASLQAALRSRSGSQLLDLRCQLQAVNQLLVRSSESSRYATLFLGIYDDATRRLVFANCGHVPPLLLRRDGSLERLHPTAPVLGLFAELDCQTGERDLAAGDLLVLFSDGITEAFSATGEEFGEQRLLGVLRSWGQSSADALVEHALAEVQSFTGGDRQDDQTLVIARVR